MSEIFEEQRQTFGIAGMIPGIKHRRERSWINNDKGMVQILQAHASTLLIGCHWVPYSSSGERPKILKLAIAKGIISYSLMIGILRWRRKAHTHKKGSCSVPVPQSTASEPTPSARPINSGDQTDPVGPWGRMYGSERMGINEVGASSLYDDSSYLHKMPYNVGIFSQARESWP